MCMMWLRKVDEITSHHWAWPGINNAGINQIKYINAIWSFTHFQKGLFLYNTYVTKIVYTVYIKS